MTHPAGAHAPGEVPIRRGDFLLVLLAALCWGTGGVLGSLLARREHLGVLSIATLRMLAGGILLLAGLALIGRLHTARLSRPAVVRIALTALLTAIFEVCFFTAVVTVSVSTATLVTIGASPVLVALWTTVVRRHRPERIVVVALLVALLGLVLLLGVAVPAGSRAALGVLVALLAAAAFGTVTILNERAVVGLDPAILTGYAFLLGGGMVLPFALAFGWHLPHVPSNWGLVVVMGLVPTAGAYVAFLTGLRTVPATTAVLLSLVEPLTAAVLAAVVLAERLGPLGIVGGLLLAVAVVLVRPRDRASPTMGEGRRAGARGPGPVAARRAGDDQVGSRACLRSLRRSFASARAGS